MHRAGGGRKAGGSRVGGEGWGVAIPGRGSGVAVPGRLPGRLNRPDCVLGVGAAVMTRGIGTTTEVRTITSTFL